MAALSPPTATTSSTACRRSHSSVSSSVAVAVVVPRLRLRSTLRFFDGSDIRVDSARSGSRSLDHRGRGMMRRIEKVGGSSGLAMCCSAGVGAEGVGRELSRDGDVAAAVAVVPVAVVPVAVVPVVPERAKVVALVAFAMCLCNADRVVMSVAVVPLAARYGWSSSFLGIVQSSFLWGYLISSVAGGALADRYGGKKVLACGAVIWSLATLLTPLAAEHSTAMLLFVRVIFGLAEGVAFPSMSTLLFRWFPGHERASALAISMGGFHLGNVLSFLVSPIILAKTGINGAFAFFASLGFLWLSVWVPMATTDPRDSPSITSAELQLIRAGKTDLKDEGSKIPPLRYVLSKLPAWACILSNFANNWGYFVLLSWMPVYFKTVYNVNLKQAAWFSAGPWGIMALSGYIAGATSDFMIKSGYPVIKSRKLMQTIGFVGPAVSLLCLRFATTPTTAAVLLTTALSLSSFSQAGYMVNIQDIAPKFAGFLHGMTNSAGTLAAIISTIGAGYFVQWLGSFEAFLAVTAALYLGITIFYNLHATADQVFS